MNEVLRLFISLSVSASMIAIMLLALKPLLQDKPSRTWQYYIWLIVIIRLLLPYTPYPGLIGMTTSQAEPYLAAEQNGSSYSNRSYTYGRTSEAAQQEELGGKEAVSYREEIANYAWLLWLGVAMLLLVRKITSYHSFVRFIRVGRVEVADSAVLEVYRRACQICGINRPLRLYSNKLAVSPMLVGLFRPVIILPDTTINSTNLYFILVHELTHYKRWDIFYKWLVQIAACIHWFNPLMYWMSKEINRNCELACDEAVLKKLNSQEKRQYGDTLIDSLKTNGVYGDSIAAVTLNEDARLLKERLAAIMSFSKPSSRVILYSLAIAIFLVGSAGLIGAYSPDNQHPAPLPLADIQPNSGQDAEDTAEGTGLFNLEANAEGRVRINIGPWFNLAIDGDDVKLGINGKEQSFSSQLSNIEPSDIQLSNSQLSNSQASNSQLSRFVYVYDSSYVFYIQWQSDSTDQTYPKRVDWGNYRIAFTNNTVDYAENEQIVESITQIIANMNMKDTGNSLYVIQEIGGPYQGTHDELTIQFYDDNKFGFFSAVVDEAGIATKDAIARKALQDGRIQFFSLVSSGLSKEAGAELIGQTLAKGRIDFHSLLENYAGDQDIDYGKLMKQAYDNKRIDFFTVMLPRLHQDQAFELALLACEDNRIAYFTLLVSRLSSEQKTELRKLIAEDAGVAFLALL